MTLPTTETVTETPPVPPSPPSETPSAEDAVKSFEEWLGTQPDAVKNAYQEHLKGLKSALAKERDTRGQLEKKVAELARQSDKDKEAALLAEQKWEEVAELRSNQIKELQTQLESTKGGAEIVSRYETFAKTLVENVRKSLPQSVLPLLERLPVLDQAEYIAANPSLFEKTTHAPVPPTPSPDGSKSLSSDEVRKRTFKLENF